MNKQITTQIKTYLLAVVLCLSFFSLKAQVVHYASDANNQWSKKTINWKDSNISKPDIIINSNINYQTIKGWGGCFNERGWRALQYLSEKEQKHIMNLLFSEVSGCAFTYCRMPMGASDYAMDYYSLNDHRNDFAMEKFSIDRDRKYLLPYIQAAINIQPKLQVWGSPWTPPAWMKENRKYFKGKMNMDPKYLDAYALYFQKYVEAYRNEGVNIVAIQPQNEPLHLPSFPSCGWDGESLKIFIKNHLGPHFEKNDMNCEIWLGTINGNKNNDEYKQYVKPVLSDPQSAKYVVGTGFQWDGDAAVDSTITHFPNKFIMQTETKCGWGTNDWKYAFETFDQMTWYLKRNCVYYNQWNMVLNETGMSSWGWKQNAMITVDTYNKEMRINPQYWIVKHYSQYIKPGAVRIGVEINEQTDALAFKNTDGSMVIVFSNPTNNKKQASLKVGTKEFSVIQTPRSFHTLVIND